MAVRLTCPDCDKTFRATDVEEGDEVRCPGCRTKFEVPSDEDEPRPRKKKKKAASTNGVLYAALGGGLAVVLIVVVLVVVLGKNRNRDNRDPGGDPPVAGGNTLTPGDGNTPARPLGTGGGTQTLQADGIARIRIEGGGRVLFAGTENDGHVGIVLTILKPGEFDKPTEQVDVYRVRTGDKVASIPIPGEAISSGAALSPGAKYIATAVPFKANTMRLIAANGTEAARFAPAPLIPDGRPDWRKELHWYTFLSDDRLLTVTNSGGYDIWSVPDLKRIGGRPGANLRGEDALFNMSDNYPGMAALTPDNRTIALFNWSGVSLIDLASGMEMSRTEDFIGKGPKPQIVRVVLSPDAKRIICLVIPSEGHADKCRLLQFDSGNGKLLKETGFPRDPATRVGEPGMYMWGPNHLVIGKPGFHSRSVVHLPTGAILNPVDIVVAPPGGSSRIDAPSFAGRLWYFGYTSVGQPGYLLGVPPTALPVGPNDKKQWAIPVKP